MVTTPLEQKKKILAQKKARVQRYEALIKIQERKEQISRRIRIGELAEKAGILHLDPPLLLGAFLSLKDGATDENKKNEWFQRGLKMLNFSEEKNSSNTTEG